MGYFSSPNAWVKVRLFDARCAIIYNINDWQLCADVSIKGGHSFGLKIRNHWLVESAAAIFNEPDSERARYLVM